MDGRDLGFTVAMGVASFPHTAHTEADLMNAADLALQEAQKRVAARVQQLPFNE